MKPLEAGASKAEVIAAVVEHERRRAEYERLLREAIFEAGTRSRLCAFAPMPANGHPRAPIDAHLETL